MMKGQPTFKTMETLHDTEVRGLTYGQLFLLAPSTRQEVSAGLVQERAASKKKGKAIVVSFAEPISGPSGRDLLEGVGRIVNFYTTARVTQSGRQYLSATLKRVLVNGDSVLNMMSLSLARKMGLTLRPQTEVVIRTAASTFHEIKYYVNLEVTVAGATVSIRCYCLPGWDTSSSYTLLLGRRWMKQVRALGDYGNNTYHIHDMVGYRYAVNATITASDIQGEIPQMCTNTHTDTAQFWDKESVSELRLSQNDLCEKLYRTICEQVKKDKTDTEDISDGYTSAFDADEESNSDEEAEENSDDGSGNESRHEVPSIQVVGGTGVARFQTKRKN